MNDHLTTERLIDFLHGELPPAEDALAHAHVMSCAACRTAHDLEASLTAALRAAATAEEFELPSLVKAAVWQQIRDAQPGPFARLASWIRPAIAVPAAALLILGGYFASPLARPAAAPMIDATYYFQMHAAQSSHTSLSERSQQAFETSLSADDGGTSPSIERAVAAAGMLDAVQ
jgi:anti-sigma factor RsiW